MPGKLYTVIYEGQVMDGHDPEKVRGLMGAALGLTLEEAGLFLMDEATVVLANADKDTAMTLRLALFRAGAVVTVTSDEPGCAVDKEPVVEGPWKTTCCPHCGAKQLPARECKNCGQRMKKPAPEPVAETPEDSGGGASEEAPEEE